MDQACCTCATRLENISPQYDEKTEKPKALDRNLECCGRVICGNCIIENPRFGEYCPFCQISLSPSSLPQGLRNPPSYTPNLSSSSSSNTITATTNPPEYTDELPSYTSLQPPSSLPTDSKTSSEPEHAEDVLHFLDHTTDTLPSLSLRYNVPPTALRRTNNLTSDHLLLARRTLLIPGTHYKGGVSLSPRPIEGEEEERRKAIVRRWQVACKVAEYDVALLYLEQANYDLELAIAVYKDDDRWEKENPLQGKGKGKAGGRTRQDVGRRRFTGQKS